MHRGMTGTLEELRREALECRRCGLAAGRHNVVFGAGQPGAKIMLIGEGPGENEDLQGAPFVGRSGQLMDKMLEYAGFSRERNVYIANMVKCRPPQNRDPAPEEIDACLPWLRGQVAALRPAIIVCVGRIAASSLIRKDFRVTREHGQFIEKNGTLMMGTFHPAALLRNPRQQARRHGGLPRPGGKGEGAGGHGVKVPQRAKPPAKPGAFSFC